ncbi:unnamed protein product [Gadus morhua 'NCC']
MKKKAKVLSAAAPIVSLLPDAPHPDPTASSRPGRKVTARTGTHVAWFLGVGCEEHEKACVDGPHTVPPTPPQHQETVVRESLTRRPGTGSRPPGGRARYSASIKAGSPLPTRPPATGGGELCVGGTVRRAQMAAVQAAGTRPGGPELGPGTPPPSGGTEHRQ